jgi:hypothetical protein
MKANSGLQGWSGLTSSRSERVAVNAFHLD